MTIGATATSSTPCASTSAPTSTAVTAGTSASGDAGETIGFAEQFRGFKAARPVAARSTRAKAAIVKAADGGDEAPEEPIDHTTGASTLAALLSRIPGAAATAQPFEFHLTGDSLPPVKMADGSGMQAGQQQLHPGTIDAQVMATHLEAAATQGQQLPAALGEQVQPQAAGAAPQTVHVSAAPAEGASEPTDLAFAARLKPGPATPANLNAAPQSGVAIPRISAISELRRTEGDNGRNQNAGSPPAQQMVNPGAQTFMTSDGPVSFAPTDKAPAPAATETRALTQDAAPVKSTEPLKELSLQVGNQNQERIEVRMVERAGELHVAVRTGNADLAHGLREGISDLVSRLEEAGFRADTWRPVHAATSVSATAGPQQSAAEFRNHSDSQSNPGWSQQQPRDQRDPQQSNRPSWVEELEGNLTPSGEPSQGDKHGLFR